MSLIDASYFVKKLNIPNTDSPEIAEAVTSYINQFEPMFLQRLFGYPLYSAYKAHSADARFTDILNGKEYTNLNGYLNKWNGLIEVLVPAPTPPATTPVAQKQSIIANFVYYHYRIENVTQFSGIGEMLMFGENANAVSPRRRLATVWNEMSNVVKQFIQFLDANQSIYPEWTYIDKVAALEYFGFVNPFF